MIDDRSIEVLIEIVFRKERDPENILKKFNITYRQLEYAIKKVNDS